jgi:hypothetical protein
MYNVLDRIEPEAMKKMGPGEEKKDKTLPISDIKKRGIFLLYKFYKMRKKKNNGT